MTNTVSEDTQFQVLRLLEAHPTLSQRQIASSLGVSLGGVNYCLKALVAKGHVKIQNFRSSQNKLRYAYLLTPAGVASKSRLTGRFLKRKLAEYEALRKEIEQLQGEFVVAGNEHSRAE